MRRALQAAGALLAAGLLMFGWGAVNSERARPDGHSPAPAPPRPERARPAPAPSLSRDLMRYGEAPAPPVVERLRPPRTEVAPAPVATPSAPPPVRVLGFVRRAGTLQVLLELSPGETLLLASGESSAGYTLVAVSEEAVRLRLPDGGEVTLAPPE